MLNEIDQGQLCLDCKDCKGYEPHSWRNICLNCKCQRESHDIRFKDYIEVNDRLRLDQINMQRLHLEQGKTKKFSSIEQGYTWQPAGLTYQDCERFFENYPNNRIPKLGTYGEKWREKALMFQMPKQDIARDFCRYLNNDSAKKKYSEFLESRNSKALDIGICFKNNSQNLTCKYCTDPIQIDALYVHASVGNNNDSYHKFQVDDDIQTNNWHPACFRCSTCAEILVDLVYCMKNNKIYCVRHYAETIKPRCFTCDELIFNSEYTRGMSQNFHTDHFSCWHCDKSLTGSRYILKDDHPYCIGCYEEQFAHDCEECKKKIGTDSKDLSYKDKHWHEKCFFCHVCKLPLVDKPFGSKNDSLYCGECYNQAFASRCDKCAQIFKPGMKKMEYKGQQFHENCFLCSSCTTPIGSKSFIPKDSKIYCVPCYEQNFATKCTLCTKVISQGGVTYKNQPFHRECFTCTNCNQSLAGQRFTSRDEHPYCSECFGKLFAKKCYACAKPITGIGGTKYISFEERHWHNDCFVCNQCHTSLVGRGFLTDAMDILCPDCGRN